ncbi:methanogeneis marker protein 16 [Methanomicrobiaceae archaeon CYW5]|uniref:methanogenesis marker 16 metalloprotein n=1 Tax=Methanovulcanius yangii TaxID=1789227 RepID=UPI0029CA9803|nr:methanogenesis marker 16 metalloprotein [Methanovulcanius yangii]MBT8508466.1 methanogeneis marker protein 16 [Methanovulcanius yangii]
MKTREELQARLARGEAEVWTAMEFKTRIREGDVPGVDEVDVVTCATFGVMSGTAAVMCVPVTKPGVFERAEAVTMEGVPCYPGPCPNERLGLVDLMVYGTAKASPRYGGGHLLRDLADGKEVEVIVESGGKTYEHMTHIDEIPFARVITTRSAFKNYAAFVNRGREAIDTIFSVTPLAGETSQATVSGCGEINPLANDPYLTHIRPGTPLMLNGSAGYVMGEGTRSSPEKPNIAAFADLAGMVSEFMGGFVTSAGPECLTSVAVPLPVLDDADIARLSILDEGCLLPVSDIETRTPLAETTYADIWQGTETAVTVRPEQCLFCGTCTAAEACPTRAIMMGGGIMHARCVACGTCVSACPNGVYSMEMGTVPVEGGRVPVALRQSDRNRAERICAYLKEEILAGVFTP